MRILYHHRTRAEDGQAVHIRALFQAFREEGHELREVALVPRDGEPPGAPRTASASRDPGAAERSGWSWTAALPRFALELAEYAYSVPAKGRIARAAREFRPDFVYERYAFGNTAGVAAAEALGLPLVLEVNSPMVLEHRENRGLAFPRLAARVEGSIFRRATRICAVTEVLAGMLVELGVSRESILVTPNGVHPERFARPDPAAARADLGLAVEPTGPVLGFVGYYRDWHRLDLVIEALRAAELAHATLVLVGAGPVEAELRACARGAGVEARVVFAGRRPNASIPALLAAFDVGLVPAINPYASPLKLIEYLAAGLAVVAPDQPNLREVCTHDRNALLVPPGDPDAVCSALARLCGDRELRARLGAAARETIVTQDLTWRGNARRVVGAVRALPGTPSTPPQPPLEART